MQLFFHHSFLPIFLCSLFFFLVLIFFSLSFCSCTSRPVSKVNFYFVICYQNAYMAFAHCMITCPLYAMCNGTFIYFEPFFSRLNANVLTQMFRIFYFSSVIKIHLQVYRPAICLRVATITFHHKSNN